MIKHLTDSGTNTTAWIGTSTYSPTLTFGGASTGITYSVQRGTYIQIGKLVLINIVLVLTSKGTATGIASVNLPLPNAANEFIRWPFFPTDVSLTGTFTDFCAVPQAGSTDCNLQEWQDSGAFVGALQDTEFTNTSNVYFCGSYITT
jgi:hypothetical protein